ncbi:MAG: beta-glucosidase BglX [Marinoscillum sp.]|uniref:beta-glucosidase BglX n=1 Tax=Marinoscillum sp. TaxID=2024838 RepID=UPI003300310B
MIRYLSLAIIMAIISVSCQPSVETNTPSDQTISDKVDSLMSLMTLTEKIGQTNMYNGTWEFTGPVPADNGSQEKAEQIKNGMVGAMINVLSAKATREAQKMAVENSRLGIPLLFGYDVIHGYKTMLPVPLAQAASWNESAARQGAEIAAREAASAGQHWTFSPMIDVSRDGRWGRIMESAGEDPYLSSVMARAWVQGYQGESLADPATIAACAKHFAAYGFAEAGRDYNTVDISDQTLFNVVFPPFKAAADAGVATFMNAFNEINGVPATGSTFLQRDILKGAWDFQGFMVSDWGSIGEMVTHGFARDNKHAAELAMNAGSDMDMESRAFERELEALITEGKVDVVALDDAVRRILKLKYELGLFEDPYRYCDEEREKNTLLARENLKGAREVAQKTMVLLKNEGNVLPLSKEVKSIAVIGQLAASKDIPLGNWRGQAVSNSAVSLLEGVQSALSTQSKVSFAEGYVLSKGTRDFIHELDIQPGNEDGFPEAIRLAKSSEVVIMALGEDCYQTGEGRSQADIGLKGNQQQLLMEILKVNKNVVVVLMNGRPLAIPEVMDQAPAIIEAWFAGSEAGNAIADVIFGDYNPSGKLPVSFPYHVGQEPLHYDRKNTGRPVTNEFDNGLVFWSHYTDAPTEALLPFGFGLSYSSFEYSYFSITPKEKGATITVEVTNSSNVAGTETVQVYVRDMVATVTQPIRRLVDFQQIEISAGETRKVTFDLSEQDFGFYHKNYQFYAEDGAFDVMVGGNSRDLLSMGVTLSF